MTDYFDDLETRDPEAREAALMAALPAQVARAKDHAPGFGEILADIDPAAVTGRTSLAALPVTRKSALIGLQETDPPFGGLTATPVRDLARLYLSPGPIADPEGTGGDFWRMARALFAGGFRKGDVVHNCFSYHFTPAGMMLDAGRAGARLRRLSGRRGQQRRAGAGDGDLPGGGLCGHAGFSSGDSRQGR